MENWVIYITNQLNPITTEPKPKPCIYKVPAFVSEHNPKVYTPHVVSFGPYHHGKEHLIPMEEHKERALMHFLRRSPKDLKYIVDSFSEDVEDLKDTYDSLDEDWRKDNKKFLKLMIMDGCFMLEIHRFAHILNDYDKNDPIFGYHGRIHKIPSIRRDMLLIENQLPMKVLYKLNEIRGEENEKNEDVINSLVLKFFMDDPPSPNMGKCLHVLDVFKKGLFSIKESEPNDDESVPNDDESEPKDDESEPMDVFKKCLHVLDVFKKGLFLIKESEPKDDESEPMDVFKKDSFSIKESEPKDDESEPNDDESYHSLIPSVREMNEAGIRFQRFKQTKNRCLIDVSFEKGVLTLPTFIIDYYTESMYLNMIAFERCHVGAGNQVSSYIYFMVNLIDDAVDINLLRTKKIIRNLIGSDEEAANLINTMGNELETDFNGGRLLEVQKEINKYCNHKSHKLRASLVHRLDTYFTQPWTLISVLAALFLFALTITQTAYTVLDYYNN